MPTYDFDEPALWFDGDTYDPREDETRLGRQMGACTALMSNYKEWTIAHLARAMSARLGRHVSEASASARIRDLRKERFGSHFVDRTRLDNGLHTYRLLSPAQEWERREYRRRHRES